MNPDAFLHPKSRANEQGDWIVRQFVQPSDLRLTPEEYVARHAHLIGTFAYHLFRFEDAELGAWVRRVGELLGSEDAVDQCRVRFLSPLEIAEARRQALEDL